MGYFKFIVLVLAIYFVRSRALRCYTCSYQFSGTSRDKECVDSPWNVTQGQKTIECPYKYCVVFRQGLKATNTIHSFHRGCEMKGRGNTCVHDSYYSTCSYTCDTDLCNVGDGVPVGSEVGQEVIHTRPVVNPRPRPPPPSRTPRPTKTRYDYNANVGSNWKNGEVGMEDGNEVTGMPKKDKTKKNDKRKDKNDKLKNEKRKGECMHPYACDQSKYWSMNGGMSTTSNSFFYVLSCIHLFVAYLQ